MKIKRIKCCVPARDSFGVPSLYLCEIVCSEDEFIRGDHYDFALDRAKASGYRPPPSNAIVIDETEDPELIAFLEGR